MLRQIRPMEIMAGGDSDSRYSPQRDWREELEIMELEAAIRAQATQESFSKTGAPSKAEAAPVNVPKPQNTPKIQLENGKPTTTVTASANISKPQSTLKILRNRRTQSGSYGTCERRESSEHSREFHPQNGAPILSICGTGERPRSLRAPSFRKAKVAIPLAGLAGAGIRRVP